MEASPGSARGPAWRGSSLAAAVLILAASWAAAPAAADGLPADEDPPQTGFGPLHDPLAPLPNREAEVGREGLATVERRHDEASGSSEDVVAARIPAAGVDAAVTYEAASDPGGDPTTRSTALEARPCVPGECVPARLAYGGLDDEGPSCETHRAWAEAAVEGEDAAYREDRTRCADGDDRNGFRCRQVQVDAAGAHLLVDRCSFDRVDEGEPTTNENTYRVLVHSSSIVLGLEQTHRLEEGATGTHAEARTPVVDVERSAGLPPDGPTMP